MSISVLESLDKSQVLIGVSTNGEVIDRNMSDNTLAIDDIGGSEGNTLIIAFLDQTSVVPGDFLVHVGQKWDIHLTETAFLPRLEGVLHMGELRVDRAGDNLASDFSELFSLVAEGDDLSRAYESEIQGVEEQHDVLSFVVGQPSLGEISLEP